MSNEANSRHTTPTVRWGETAAQVPSANVVEPSGGVKDVGWVPAVDGLIGEFLNWCTWSVGVFLRYIENTFAIGLTANHVMAGAAAGEGLVTAGAGLTVNVASSRDWIAGQMQLVPAVVNLALAVADPTDPRVDLVVARVTGGVPLYAVRTGTPGASPSAPAALVGDAPHAEVRVEAAGVAPGTITDRREFGKLSLGRIIASARLDAGSTGGSDAMFYVDGPTQQGRLGSEAAPCLSFATAGGMVASSQIEFQDDVEIKPEQFTFNAPIIRRFDIDSAGFQLTTNSAAASHNTTGHWQANADAVLLMAAVRVPNGATITRVRLTGEKGDAANGLRLRLVSILKTTGVATTITDVNNTAVGGTGAFQLQSGVLATVVNQLSTYRLLVDFVRVSDFNYLYGAEVEYTEDTPFDGL